VSRGFAARPRSALRTERDDRYALNQKPSATLLEVIIVRNAKLLRALEIFDVARLHAVNASAVSITIMDAAVTAAHNHQITRLKLIYV